MTALGLATADVTLVPQDELAERLLAYARARAYQQGTRSWADRVERGHRDYTAAQRRAHEAAEETQAELYALGLTLFASPDDTLAHEAFIEAFQRVTREAYGQGFDERYLPNPNGFDEQPGDEP